MKNWLAFAIGILFMVSCKGDPSTSREEINPEADTTQIIQTNTELTDIEQYIITNPNSEKGYYQLASYYLKNNQPDLAFTQVNKAMKMVPKDPDINLLKGKIYVALNKLDLGLPFIERSVELDSLHIEGNLALADIYLKGKDLDNSVKLINTVISQNQYLAEPYFLKGIWYEMQGKTDLAISSYQTTIERNPNYYDAYLKLGTIYNNQDNPLAIQYFNSAISIHPKSIEAWRMKGMSYFDHEQFDLAIGCFDTILSFDSTFEVSHFDIGRAHLGMCYDNNPKTKNDSLLKEAITHFDKALFLNENYVPARYNRALCYENLGNLTLAKTEYKKILEIEVNYEPAVNALNRLER